MSWVRTASRCRSAAGACVCPIHGGENASAFSFKDAVYRCHACGAGGDVFELVLALRRCTSFPEAVAVVATLAGIGVDGLPRIDTADVERRQKIQRRRQALRRWRDLRLGEWLTLIGNLTREAETLARWYLDRAGDEANPDGEGWTLLASLHGDLQTAEVMAATLSVDDEQEWARLWLGERRGLVVRPQELTI
jgi:CHC2 zinc finger